MVITCWSVKGGSGTTVVAAALATRLSRMGPVTIVDLAGDQPAVLGLSSPSKPGLASWLREWPASDELRRLAIPVASQLDLLAWHGAPSEDAQETEGAEGNPLGLGILGSLGEQSGFGAGQQAHGTEASAALGEALARWHGTVVVDAGTLVPSWLDQGSHPAVLHCSSGSLAPDNGVSTSAVPTNPARAMLGVASASLLVTRPCFLGLHRALRLPQRPTGVVMVEEPTRSMGRRQVEQVLGLPVVAQLPWDGRVTRSIDGGTLVSRLPRSLDRALAGIPTNAVVAA